MTGTEIALQNDRNFRIIASEKGLKSEVHISPDMAICSDCLKELFRPGGPQIPLSFHQLHQLRPSADDHQGDSLRPGQYLHVLLSPLSGLPEGV